MAKTREGGYRITLVSLYFDSDKYSGANKRLISILDELRQKDNIQLTVIVGKYKVSGELKKSMNSVLWLEWNYSGSILSRIIIFIRLFIYRVFHSNIIISDFFPPIPFFKNFYYLVHDIRIGTDLNRNTFKVIRAYLQSYLMRFAKNIITVSNSSKKDIIKALGKKNDIYVIENGLSQIYYSTCVNKEDRDINLLYVADSDIRKNHAYLNILLSKIPVPLVVYLVGVNKTDIDFQVGRHKIVFKKNIPESQLVNIYSRTQVYICPSELEGFNMPVLEALAMGCNVLCSNIRVHRELFGDQENVEFLTGETKVDEELLLESMKRKNDYINIDFVNKFSWKYKAEELIQIVASSNH